MNEYRNQYPLLRQLLGGYFHQDWMIVHKNEESAIRSFVFDDGTEEALQTLKELDALLARNLPESTLDQVVNEDMSCEYNPGSDGGNMTSWLHWVRDTLSKYAAEKAEQEKSENK